jgi:ribose 5-phosphate isomerase B
MRISIGADHAGVALKATIGQWLTEQGIDVDDQGTMSCESVDYPDYARAVGERVAQGAADLGILICGTGIGMAMAANKIPGIRAACATSEIAARLGREHNNANVLTLGARLLDGATALKIVEAWLRAEFAGGRHQRRLDKIAELEQEALQQSKT